MSAILVQQQEPSKSVIGSTPSKTPEQVAKELSVTDKVDTSPKEVDRNSDSKDPKLSEAFTRITKQENYIREERRKIEESKKAWEVDKSEADQFRKLKKMKEADPLQALESLGLSYDSLSQYVNSVKNPVDPVVKRALNELSQIKEELHSSKERETKERISKAEQYVETQITQLTATPDYDIIAKVGAEKAVREFMEKVYDETGEIPEVKDACEAVAEHIAELYQQIATNPRLTKKKAAEITEAKEKLSPSTAEDYARTLSNKLTQSTVAREKPMTDAERMAAAMAVFKAGR